MSSKANTARLKKITDKARKIRKRGETWISAVKRAAKEVSTSLSPSKKAARKKSAKVGKTASKSRQTGSSNLKRDRRVKAKAPGKRVVKRSGGKKHVYYERRKNRSDKPGKLTGVGSAYRQNVLQRVNSSVRLLSEAENKLAAMQKALKDIPAKETVRKRMMKVAIADQKKYIKALKADVRGFKSLIR